MQDGSGLLHSPSGREFVADSCVMDYGYLGSIRPRQSFQPVATLPKGFGGLLLWMRGTYKHRSGIPAESGLRDRTSKHLPVAKVRLPITASRPVKP